LEANDSVASNSMENFQTNSLAFYRQKLCAPSLCNNPTFFGF
jgi:hypothetical protein